MMNEKLRVYLEYRKPGENKLRFYLMKIEPGLFGDFALISEWGRISHPGKLNSKWFSTESEAMKSLLQKQKEKIRRGYIKPLS